jgi:hypothetical protein
MPELEGQWIADDGLDCASPKCVSTSSYSLSASQVHNDLGFVILLQEATYNLLDCMHAKPVAAVDEWISPDKLGRERLIVIWLIAKVELRDASFRDDAAVIGLSSILVKCSWLEFSLVAGMLTFMTSSSLLAFFDRMLPFGFALPSLGFFIIVVADVVVSKTGPMR